MARRNDVPTFGLLSGVRVVSHAQVIAGPFGVELWAENGADVIWIENAQNPDSMRNKAGLGGPRDRQNMRALALNITKPEGRDVFLKLMKDTDIVVEASRGGTFDKWGMSDDVLWQQNPALVIAHVSGFGQTGDPDYVKRGAWDTIGQAFSGFMVLNGNPDPEPPSRATPSTCDYVTSLTLCWSALAALLKAKQTGKGESIDIAMYEAMLRVTGEYPQRYGTWGVQVPRTGNEDFNMAGYKNYRCKDGKYIATVFLGPTAMTKALKILGLEWGSEDFPKMMPFVKANTPGAEIFEAAMQAFCAARTAEEAEKELNENGAAAQVIMDFKDLMANPHTIARKNFIDIDDPVYGLVKGAVAPVPRLKNFPQRLWRNIPATGADNQDIMTDLGYSEEQIKTLYENGALSKP